MSLYDIVSIACTSMGIDDQLAGEVAARVCEVTHDYMIPIPLAGAGYVSASTPLGCAINDYYQPVSRHKLGKTKKGRVLREGIAAQLKLAHSGEPMIGKVAMRIDTWPNDHHAAKVADVDAYAKCGLDAVQDAGLVTDDAQVTTVILNRLTEKTKGGRHQFTVYEY